VLARRDQDISGPRSGHQGKIGFHIRPDADADTDTDTDAYTDAYTD
jgi:hypothetical protein